MTYISLNIVEPPNDIIFDNNDNKLEPEPQVPKLASLLMSYLFLSYLFFQGTNSRNEGRHMQHLLYVLATPCNITNQKLMKHLMTPRPQSKITECGESGPLPAFQWSIVRPSNLFPPLACETMEDKMVCKQKVFPHELLII